MQARGIIETVGKSLAKLAMVARVAAGQAYPNQSRETIVCATVPHLPFRQTEIAVCVTAQLRPRMQDGGHLTGE